MDEAAGHFQKKPARSLLRQTDATVKPVRVSRIDVHRDAPSLAGDTPIIPVMSKILTGHANRH
jgi:hypothetical protein